MKQTLLLVLSLLCLVNKAHANTVSGTVASSTTCAPLSGVVVYAFDSTRSWKDSAVTNASGFYSINIPSTLYTAAGGTLMVSTSTTSNWTIYKPGLDAHCNLITSNGTTWGVVYGDAVLGSGLGNIQAAKLWLIRRDVNPTTLDTVLTAIDSNIYVTRFSPAQTDANMFRFMVPCVTASDRYLVKAALLPSDPAYMSYMPTYSDSALSWNADTAISISASPFVHIYMKQGVNPGGPGFIGGSVLLGANKSAGVGDPLNHRILFLTTSTGKGIGYTYSDASGKFSFSNLPLGTYKIFGDAPGKTNPALTLTLSQTNSSVSDVIFEENSKKFEGHLGTTGVSITQGLAGISVYPNPVKDVVRVQGLEAIEGSKTLVLTNLAGLELSRHQISMGEGNISTAALPSGIYLLEVRTNAGNTYFRIVK